MRELRRREVPGAELQDKRFLPVVFHQTCETLWAEFVQEKVLRPVHHVHVVFTLPKMLRPYFKFHRDLLPQLCLCAWESLREYFVASLSKNALPGAILTINTAGEFLGWQPHVHGIVPCGGFLPDGEFESVPRIDAGTVRKIFEAKVFSMLLKRELISRDLVNIVVETYGIRCLDRPRYQGHERDR